MKGTILFMGVLIAELVNQPALASLRGKLDDTKESDLSLDEVPLEIHRRAAQLVEDVRDTESAPGWEAAFIADNVRSLLRPDVDGVAYYEFKVDAEGERKGFIIASTGPFDYPIAHWNFEGLSPTEELDEISSEIVRYYKLDTLSYAGENAQGEMVANIGGVPPEIEGLTTENVGTRALDERESGIETFERDPGDADANAAVKIKDDHDSEDDDNSKERWTFKTKTASWKKRKNGFEKSYEVPITSLRKVAAHDWETEKFAAEFGEGLTVGEPFEVALLFPLDSFEIRGSGSAFVEAEESESASGQSVLVLTATEAPEDDSLEVELVLKYVNKVTETIKFAIIPKKALREIAAEEGSDNDRALSHEAYWVDDSRNLWGSWNTFWAKGGSDAQRAYGQIPKGQSPNTSKCVSGCGATAWGMLFGWADYMASKSGSGWEHRWGLYRENGGTGNNVVAPKTMDRGVKNMIWEIRNYVETFCWSGSGATYPWKMKHGTKYSNRRSRVGWSIKWDNIGIKKDSLRKHARDTIIDKKSPAIIGTGWLSHYPLAYGYRWRKRRVKKCLIWCWHETQYQRQFYVNQGWNGSGNGWIGADTWFSARIIP